MVAQLAFAFDDDPGPPRPAPSGPKPKRHKGPVEHQLDLARVAEDEDRWFAAERTVPERARLENVLRAALGPRVVLWLTDNASTMVSSRRRGESTHVRVHQVFVDAPEGVLDALGRFLAADAPDPRDQAVLDQYVESHRGTLKEVREQRVRIEPFGEFHDLARILDRVNRDYFAGAVDARITWSSAAKGKQRTSITLGTYCHELRLIRVHPALDQPFVPDYFLEYVVFHEALHQFHDPDQASGRQRLHPSTFEADERRFRRYGEAKAWEARNISKLLRF
ncbi:MAG: hypothetical protein HYV07_00920 [Deltaproteobacteria bacterium]|nr:hypothetical protein [Deltaproteobacteria bacterium]